MTEDMKTEKDFKEVKNFKVTKVNIYFKNTF